MAILPEKKIVDPSNAKKLAAEAQHLSRAADVVRKRAVGQLRYAKECRSTAEEASARFKARIGKLRARRSAQLFVLHVPVTSESKRSCLPLTHLL